MSESDNIDQEVEIHSDVSLSVADSRESSQELEPFFPNRRIVHNIAVNREEDIATALSELSGKDTLLTDVTIHAFMVS